MSRPGRYPLAVGIALLGLGPDVVLSTALVPVREAMAHSVGSGQAAVSLAIGLGSAGYAVGAVLAAQLALRVVQRRLFLAAEALFAAAAAGAALAPDLAVLAPALVLQGLAAGAMLISSLPPLVTRFGAGKVALSAGIVDVGIFGASTLGPILGGVVAGGGPGGTEGWRWLFGGAAVLAVLGGVVAVVGYERWDPAEPDARVDVPALALVVVTTGAGFVAASLVAGHPLASGAVAGPAVLAVLALGALLVVESRRADPLIPVTALTTQLPVTGILVAMVGGAVVVTAADLLQTLLGEVGGHGPASVAAAFWPMPVGAVLGAVVFWRLFRTRFVPVLVDAGLACLAGGCLVALAGHVSLATFLLGLGAATTVSPGLFLTGLGLRSSELGRGFALVQLLRSLATYAVGPVVLAVVVRAADERAATRAGLVAMAVTAGVALVAALVIPAVSGARLRAPDLEAWLEGDQGLPSPATAVHLRPGVEDQDAEPLLPERLRHRRR